VVMDRLSLTLKSVSNQQSLNKADNAVDELIIKD